MTEGDPAFGQIVRREFQRDFIARQNANTIPPETAREVRQNHPFMLELDAEQTAGKFLKNRSRHFYAVFLAHSTSRIKTAGSGRRVAIAGLHKPGLHKYDGAGLGNKTGPPQLALRSPVDDCECDAHR